MFILNNIMIVVFYLGVFRGIFYLGLIYVSFVNKNKFYKYCLCFFFFYSEFKVGFDFGNNGLVGIIIGCC